MKQTIDHWSLKETPGIGMIKIRTLKDETNQLETLKETHGDTLGVRIIILSACNKKRVLSVRSPTKGALGLRHVGYGIPTELFGPFVSSAIEKIRSGSKRRKELLYRIHPWKL